MSGIPYLVVAGCEAGDTILNDEMGCVGITEDNEEPTVEGMYLHMKSLLVYTLKYESEDCVLTFLLFSTRIS